MQAKRKANRRAAERVRLLLQRDFDTLAMRVHAHYRHSLRFDPCAYCGTRPRDWRLRTVDHIVPRAHGGLNRWPNWTCACFDCNTRKSATSLLQFLLAESRERT